MAKQNKMNTSCIKEVASGQGSRPSMRFDSFQKFPHNLRKHKVQPATILIMMITIIPHHDYHRYHDIYHPKTGKSHLHGQLILPIFWTVSSRRAWRFIPDKTIDQPSKNQGESPLISNWLINNNPLSPPHHHSSPLITPHKLITSNHHGWSTWTDHPPLTTLDHRPTQHPRGLMPWPASLNWEPDTLLAGTWERWLMGDKAMTVGEWTVTNTVCNKINNINENKWTVTVECYNKMMFVLYKWCCIVFV